MTRIGRVHEVLQDLFFRQAGGPTVGAGHGGVQLVVQFFEDADQAFLVDLALLEGNGRVPFLCPGPRSAALS